MNSKARHSLYKFKYAPRNKNEKTFSKPYVWHIHGDDSELENIILDFYSYGKNLSVLHSYGQKFIARYITCCKKQMPEFLPQSWLDYFLMGNVYIVGLGLDTDEYELQWLLCYRNHIHSILDERIKKIDPDNQFDYESQFGKVYYMDATPVYNEDMEDNSDLIDIRSDTSHHKFQNNFEQKRKEMILMSLGCYYGNFCPESSGNSSVNGNELYFQGYLEIKKHLDIRKTDDFNSVFKRDI